jgi:cell wall assembly regulator SMI1
MDTHGIAVAKAELDASAGEFAWKKTWLPFLDDDEGNYVVLDTRVKPSQVMAFWIGEKAEKLSASLGDWLMNLVEGLEAGAYQEDSERGTLTRRV